MFFKKKIVNNSKQYLPILDKLHNGTCYIISGTTVYVKDGKMYKFYSPRAEASWKLQPVTISDDPWRMVPFRGTLGFRDGTLIQNAKDGRIYLISDSKRNLLTRPLSDYGFDWSMVIEASDDEVNFHKEGPDS